MSGKTRVTREYLGTFTGLWCRCHVGDRPGPFEVLRARLDDDSVIWVDVRTADGEASFRAQDCSFNKDKGAL